MSKRSKSTMKMSSSSDEQMNEQSPGKSNPNLDVTNTNSDVDRENQISEEISKVNRFLTEIKIKNMFHISPKINVSSSQRLSTHKQASRPGQNLIKTTQLNALRTFHRLFRGKKELDKVIRVTKRGDRSSGLKVNGAKEEEKGTNGISSKTDTTQTTFLTSTTLSSSSDSSTSSILDQEESDNDGAEDEIKEKSSPQAPSSGL
ncbi:unnamed protein product [Rodentolepis nana]|uniref:Uncharacterized protein n=1 Tax=Rodentolepis nana TaxID=102285 RepID=A0A0R3TT65_RODNA|nr:unnamed protein product [Rodentolepis nana]